MSGSSVFAADFSESPYWWRLASPSESADRPPEGRIDVAIVGGGYSGLSAALVLAQSGRSVVVLEAAAFGSGASTLSGGSVVPGVRMHFPVGGDSDEDQTWRKTLLEESTEAFDRFERALENLGVDLYTGRVGRFVGAHSPKAFDRLVVLAEEMKRTGGSEYKVVPRDQQASELETDYYHGGVVTLTAGGVHPSAYHQALFQRCKLVGVTLCGQAPVKGISGSAGQFVLDLGTGRRVNAKEVIIATNAYTGSATPWHRRRIIPIESHMIATEELGTDAIRRLMPSMRVYGDSKRVPWYFRPSPDGQRLLFGGRASFGNIDLRTSAQRLYSHALEVFPNLEGAKIAHAWKGKVGFTFDYIPHIGARDGIHYCLGCNGAGIVMMSYLGAKVAEKVVEPKAPLSAFEAKPFQTRPFYTGKPWFLPLIGEYYRFRDRMERKARAPGA